MVVNLNASYDPVTSTSSGPSPAFGQSIPFAQYPASVIAFDMAQVASE